jgi:diguanylate cyclase (GGDEF)-like protein/putative nucleotidyltransferase with HDIG domain
MITAASPRESTPLIARPRFSHWRYLANAVLFLTFLYLFSLASQERITAPTLGITAAQDNAGTPWTIATINPLSDAANSRARQGDLIRAIDGRPIEPTTPITQELVNRAQQIVLERPATGEVITIEAAHNAPRTLNVSPYLLLSIAFLVVGLFSSLFGRGAAPQALALLCYAGALEGLTIPFTGSSADWVVVINGICVPLFMGSFAYLFLVFPIKRPIPLGTNAVPPLMVLLPAPLISILYVLATIDNHLLLATLNRVVGFAYFSVCLIGGVWLLFRSWRRTETTRERAQLQLIAIGMLLAISPVLSLTIIPQALLRRAIIPAYFTVLPLALIPLSFGYAILRYQLMDMHLYVRRGVLYSALGAIITAAYAIVLAFVTIAVRDRAAIGSVAVVALPIALIVLTGDRLRALLQRQIDRLFDREGYDYRQQLLEFGQRMNNILDPDELAQSTVDLIRQTMGAHHARLYLHDRNEGAFHHWVKAGADATDEASFLSPQHPTVLEVRAAGWAIVQHFEIGSEEDALLVPLIHKGQPVALLKLGLKRDDLPYSSEDLTLLRTVAGQLAIATENAQLYGRMRDLYLSGIRTLAATVDAKDSYTHGHSERVAAYARAIALTLELPQLEVETIELAGLLHDIGKIGVPDAVLQKPGHLEPDERALIEQHADLGARILADNSALRPLVPLVRHHHERYDGGGYPSGLRGEEIPLGAAIICVADTFDTMTTDRPYRRAPGLEEARREIVRCGGQQFDPRVVAAFLRASASPGWLLAPHQRATEQSQGLAVASQAIDVNTRAMRIVYQIAQLLGSSIELPAFLQRVVELLRRELGTRSVEVYILDRTSGALIGQLGVTPEIGPMTVPPGQGLVGWVAERRSAVRLDDVCEDTRPAIVDGWSVRSQLAVPLLSEGRIVGVLNAESTRVAAFDDEDTTLLTIIAGQLAQVIEVAQLHEEMRQIARLDGLTSIANHRHFYERLEETLDETSETLALALLDVDGLKALNDIHGHLAGDAALRTLAGLLSAHSLPNELVARYGGDEFAILFPGQDEAGAQARVATLLAAVYRTPEFEVEGTSLPLPAISVGVAARSQDRERALSLVALADERMYHQKRARRAARPGACAPQADNLGQRSARGTSPRERAIS